MSKIRAISEKAAREACRGRWDMDYGYFATDSSIRWYIYIY